MSIRAVGWLGSKLGLDIGGRGADDDGTAPHNSFATQELAGFGTAENRSSSVDPVAATAASSNTDPFHGGSIGVGGGVDGGDGTISNVASQWGAKLGRVLGQANEKATEFWNTKVRSGGNTSDDLFGFGSGGGGGQGGGLNGVAGSGDAPELDENGLPVTKNWYYFDARLGRWTVSADAPPHVQREYYEKLEEAERERLGQKTVVAPPPPPPPGGTGGNAPRPPAGAGGAPPPPPGLSGGAHGGGLFGAGGARSGGHGPQYAMPDYFGSTASASPNAAAGLTHAGYPSPYGSQAQLSQQQPQQPQQQQQLLPQTRPPPPTVHAHTASNLSRPVYSNTPSNTPPHNSPYGNSLSQMLPLQQQQQSAASPPLPSVHNVPSLSSSAYGANASAYSPPMTTGNNPYAAASPLPHAVTNGALSNTASAAPRVSPSPSNTSLHGAYLPPQQPHAQQLAQAYAPPPPLPTAAVNSGTRPSPLNSHLAGPAGGAAPAQAYPAPHPLSQPAYPPLHSHSSTRPANPYGGNRRTYSSDNGNGAETQPYSNHISGNNGGGVGAATFTPPTQPSLNSYVSGTPNAGHGSNSSSLHNTYVNANAAMLSASLGSSHGATAAAAPAPPSFAAASNYPLPSPAGAEAPLPTNTTAPPGGNHVHSASADTASGLTSPGASSLSWQPQPPPTLSQRQMASPPAAPISATQNPFAYPPSKPTASASAQAMQIRSPHPQQQTSTAATSTHAAPATLPPAPQASSSAAPTAPTTAAPASARLPPPPSFKPFRPS